MEQSVSSCHCTGTWRFSVGAHKKSHFPGGEKEYGWRRLLLEKTTGNIRYSKDCQTDSCDQSGGMYAVKYSRNLPKWTLLGLTPSKIKWERKSVWILWRWDVFRENYECVESVNCGAGDKILSTEGSCNLCGEKVDYTKSWSQSQWLADGKNDWLGFCQTGSLRAGSQEKSNVQSWKVMRV